MAYRYWSPLASPAYAWYQVKIILRNIAVCLALLTSMEVAWLIPAYYLLVQIARPSLRHQRWPTYLLLFIVPILLLALYLPTSVNLAEQRFFYPAFPFLFAAVALWANESPPTNAQGASQSHHVRTWWLGVLGVAAPLLAAVVLLGNSPKYAGDVATDLAPRIQRANLAGPIAGSGMLPGGRAGLYLAFLLNQPWFGDEPNPEPSRLLRSGARLVVVNRQSQLAHALSQDPGFFSCDAQLFDNTQQAGYCPLQVYAVKGWSAGPSG
jgi:hypothetical protein